jgi:hypothetical protein
MGKKLNDLDSESVSWGRKIRRFVAKPENRLVN